MGEREARRLPAMEAAGTDAVGGGGFLVGALGRLDSYVGTEATRTSIIGNAIKYKYISIKNNKYQLEPAGENLIQVLDRLKINLYKEKTVETNQWLKQISRGELTPAEAVAMEAKELRNNILNNKEVIPAPITSRALPENSLGLCPTCNRPVYENSKGFYCSGFRLGCKFTLWKNDRNMEGSGVSIDRDLVKELLQTGAATRADSELKLEVNQETKKTVLKISKMKS